MRKLYFLCCGYLQLKITGGQEERLINRLVEEGVKLWGLTREDEAYYINIKAGDWKQVQLLIEEMNCTVNVIDKRGIPFLLDKLLTRRFLVVGIILLLIAIWGLSNFVFFIEVTGTEKVAAEEIKKIISDQGIKPGVLKSSIDLEQLKKILIQREKRLSWVHTHFQGVKLIIEVEEKELVEKVDSCDLVADKAGIITDLIVLKGTPQVEEGMTVSKGEVLISRYVPVYEDKNKDKAEDKEETEKIKEYREVKAAGIAKARVWYEGYGEAKLVKYYQQPSGNVQTSLIVKYKNKEVVISGPKTPPYTNFKVKEQVKSLPEWRNYSLPVELITRRYIQVKEFKEKRSFKQAKKLSRKRALDNILQRLTKKPIILNSEFKLINVNQTEKVVRMKGIIEIKEDIAVRRE